MLALLLQLETFVLTENTLPAHLIITMTGNVLMSFLSGHKYGMRAYVMRIRFFFYFFLSTIKKKLKHYGLS